MKYYHGARRHGPYFEGWYLKFQTKGGRALALIPASHIDEGGRSCASLQIISERESWWLEYPNTEFHASEKQFQLRMGQSMFCDKGVHLNVDEKEISLHGTLRCGQLTPLKSDIMGPFKFLAGMECAHGVISMGHSVDGTLTLNGEILDFSGGIGYVETDRGRSFPRTYLWTQCAWQEPRRGGLMLSIATIPMAIGSFTGCICAINYNGREYRLATYRGVKIEQWSGSGAVIRQGEYRFAADVLKHQKHPLRAPVEGNMERTIHESLCSRIRYRFWEGDKLLFDRTASCASFEYSDKSAHCFPS